MAMDSQTASVGDSSSGGVQCVFGESRWKPPIRRPFGTVSRPCSLPRLWGACSHQKQDALVSCSSLDDPQQVNIDCTGLGGHDLGGFPDYDICIRTDKHSQSIYGPSVTPLESPGRDGTHHVSLVVPKIWPLTVRKNGTSSWTPAYLSAHGYCAQAILSSSISGVELAPMCIDCSCR